MTGNETDPTVNATRWLVDQELIGIVLLDPDGIVVDSYGGLVDWVEAGRHSSDCMGFLEGHQDALAAVAQGRQASLHLSGVRHPQNDGELGQLVSIRGFPTEGRPGLTLVFQTLTAAGPSIGRTEQQRNELALAERRTAQAQESAKAANQAKSLFLANVSHELRTPLNVIIGNAEILRDWDPGTFSAEDLHIFADDILDNGTFLLDHINDLLDLARAEVGGIELDEEEIDIGLVVDGAVSAVRKTPHAGTLTIRHRPADDLPLLVGDAQRLRQILLNLLVDAVRVAANGGSVMVRTFTADDNALMIEIAVDGSTANRKLPGDEPQPFGMAPSATDGRPRPDSALGLPLAKTLIELHDGTLTLDNLPGETARLTLRFPPKRTRAAA